MTAKPLPLIDISGPPEKRGLEYGEQARDYIHLAIKNYRAAYREMGISWEEACSISSNFIPMLEKCEHELFTEIKAIAKGCGLQTKEILALNCRTEIFYGSRTAVEKPSDGCTGAIALPGITENGHLLHGQNWDWRDECADTSIVLRITPEKGPRILTQTEAGNLARCGMNENGIALTGNFLKCDRDNKPGGIPIPFIRRHILEQGTLFRALEVALKSQKSFSTNLMISDGGGEGINLETVPGETFWLMPQEGLLVHANHFEATGALAKLVDLSVQVAPCSLYRKRRVHASLIAQAGYLTLDDFKIAFTDNFGAPAAVCAQPDNGPGGDTSSTVATILMDVTARRMWVAPRPYLAHKYTEYGFQD